MSVHSESCEGRWLINDEAHVVLAQIAPISADAIKAVASRAAVITMLSGLLSGTRRLAEIVTQGRPAILILPELALAFSDWDTVDALVRSYPSQLILISGFSFTRGNALRSWLAANPSITERRAAWNIAHAPAAERTYNCGWCWIHRPGNHTTCIAFQKVTAEQREEIKIDTLDTGQNTFCLELDDLIIFPVICSDFLSVVEGQRLIANRIAQDVTLRQNDARKILIAGLLCQHKAHQNWRAAISDIARLINVDKVNICLINWAYDILLTQEEDDRWRDYSGIYLASERRPSQYQMMPIRRFSTDTIEGAVTRTTLPCVVGGPIRWLFNGAARHIWAANHGYTLADDGSLTGPCCDNSLRYELFRFLRRLTEASDVQSASITTCISDGLKHIKDHLESGDAPSPTILIQTVLFGETNKPWQIVEADGIPKFERELRDAFKALGGLRLVAGLQWQHDSTIRGQLRYQDGCGILVWSSPDMSIRVKQTIAKWRSDALRISPLIIFYKASGQMPTGVRTSERRADISAAPASKTRSAAEPAQPNAILEADLDELSQHLQEVTIETAVAELSSVVSEKLAAINLQEAH